MQKYKSHFQNGDHIVKVSLQCRLERQQIIIFSTVDYVIIHEYIVFFRPIDAFVEST